MKWLGVLVFGGVLAMSGTRSEAVVELQDFDQQWNYDHPDSTEAVFRALLPQARARGSLKRQGPGYLLT